MVKIHGKSGRKRSVVLEFKRISIRKSNINILAKSNFFVGKVESNTRVDFAQIVLSHTTDVLWISIKPKPLIPVKSRNAQGITWFIRHCSRIEKGNVFHVLHRGWLGPSVKPNECQRNRKE